MKRCLHGIILTSALALTLPSEMSAPAAVAAAEPAATTGLPLGI